MIGDQSLFRPPCPTPSSHYSRYPGLPASAFAGSISPLRPNFNAFCLFFRLPGLLVYTFPLSYLLFFALSVRFPPFFIPLIFSCSPTYHTCRDICVLEIQFVLFFPLNKCDFK